ncbi:TRAP-type C4-dicarboxylate transport system, small permease component [Hoeflea sp. IMCC20628]|uniref:TRAP transporter small permease n=1 Tax=Hoeflea sp. IMCC20628 TaxID=1620421 RepID=UPI00063AEF32|nr:TRAP transporter small permease [Hoeflea sp. IMCC20628]AKH99684.1 TRAP-type C4-dicarboxylate transport system, small permease component [Hoeflea sp. IMCC20628]
MHPDLATGTLGALARAEAAILGLMKWMIILGMSGMVFVVFLQIVSRYVFSLSLGWSEEVARLLFISIVFLGAAVLARQGQHLTVTVVVDLFGPRVRHLLFAIASGVGLVCSWYLVQGGWATMLREWDQRTPALQLPMGIIFAIIFASVSLMAIWMLVVMLMHARAALTGDKP